MNAGSGCQDEENNLAWRVESVVKPRGEATDSLLG